MGSFLYKPAAQGSVGRGNAAFLLPGASSAGIYDDKGNKIEDLRNSGNGKFTGSRFGADYGPSFTVRINNPDGTTTDYKIGNSGKRHTGDMGNPDSIAIDTSSHQGEMDTSGMPAGMEPIQVGEYGVAPAFMAQYFPSPVFGTYKKIKTAPYEFTDPQAFAEKYGEFSREEIKKNYGLASDLALKELDTELAGMKQFVPAAAALKRNEISMDNWFNQYQRTSQVDTALPGVREQLAAQGRRAETYAGGRIPDEQQDRALELGMRSEAADTAAAAGFGAASSVSRKASDLLSAKERLQIASYGEQLLGSNISAKTSLLLAPTEYSNVGQEIRVMPTLSGSQLAASNLSAINQMAGIPATTAYANTIQQRQFGTQLEQQTRQFNAQNQLQLSEFNANIANEFGLQKFQYLVGYAGTLAGAAQTNINTETAIAQQEQNRKIFDEFMNESQKQGTISSITEGLGVVGGIIASVLSGGGGSLSGGTKTTGGGGTVSEGGSYEGQPSATSQAITPNVEEQAPVVSGPGVTPEPTYTDVTTGEAPAGAEELIPYSATAQPAVLRNMSADTGTNVSLSSDPSQGVTRQMLSMSTAPLNAAGLSYVPGPGMEERGYDPQGQKIYTNPTLAASNDIGVGQRAVNVINKALDPTGVLTDADASKLEQIGTISSDASFMASLADAKQRGDAKAFNKLLVDKIGKAAAQSFIDNPQGQDAALMGLSGYRIFSNWDNMSPAQRSLALASLGVQGFRTGTGINLAKVNIIDPVKDGSRVTTPGLNVGQALTLLHAGVNVYSMINKWDQLSDLQKAAAGTGTAADVAYLAHSFNLLGEGTQGTTAAAVGTQAGVQAGTQAGASTAGMLVPGLSAAAYGVTFTEGAKTVYDNWGKGGIQGRQAGAIGGSAMYQGLSNLSYFYPGLGEAACIAATVGPMVGTGKSKDQSARDGMRGLLQKTGILDENYNVTLADGTKADVGIDGGGGKHSVTDISALTKEDEGRAGKNSLSAYDVDYTNSLDFTSSMGGIGLARLLAGGKGKNIDQLGSQLGNAALGQNGYNQAFTPDSFNRTMTNLKAMYAKAGITSKKDVYDLANQAFSEGRLNESDVLALHQTADMMYDQNGFGTAARLTTGKYRGMEVAQSNAAKESATTVETPNGNPINITKNKIPAILANAGAAGKKPPLSSQVAVQQPGVSSTAWANVPYRKAATAPRASVFNLTKDQIRSRNKQLYAERRLVA